MVVAVPAAAQSKLTTQDVIKMVKAGLPESVVIATIKAAGATFDLGASAIIELHKAGVSAKIIEAMVETSKKKGEAPKEVSAKPPPGPSEADRARQAEERRRRTDEEDRQAARRRERRDRDEDEDGDRRVEKRRPAEDRRLEEKRRREAEERKAEERKAEERKAKERRREGEERQAEERRREDEERRLEEKKRREAERSAAEQRRREAEERLDAEKRGREEAARAAEERRREEERRAAEERRREEADRRAEERRRRDESDQRKRVEEQRISEKFAVVGKAKDLGSGGQHWASAAIWYEFYTQHANPDTQEQYDAEFFLAQELHEAGLGQAALTYLTNVVKRGPRDPNFRRAFRRLRVVSEQLLVTSPEVMEKLAEMSVADLPRDFRDEFNYTLGKFYNRWGNHTKALRFLEQVSEASAFYASTAYLRGLIMLRDKKPKTAHDLFKRAVLAAEKSPGKKVADVGVLELGYMALARLAYEVGGYDAAVFYYNKVPHVSTKLGQALFEKGWTYFQAGNHQMALGTFHGLHSPYFADRFHPDLYILEATIYLNMCHASMAKELVERYQKGYSKLHQDLKALLARGTPPHELFQMFLTTGEKRAEGGLPAQLYSYVLQDAEFADQVAALRDYDKQARILGSLTRGDPKSDKLWREALAAVEARRERLYRSAGLMIRQKLQKAEQELGEFLIKADEIMFETINAEKEQLDREATALMTGEQLKEAGKLKQAEKLKVPWSHLYWTEQKGEVWADEVDAYRSLLEDGCKR
jgi:hypothetical protein